VRENDIVAKVNEFSIATAPTTSRRSTHLGRALQSASAYFTDRMVRPGDQAFSTFLQSFMGYRQPATTGPQCRPRHAGAAGRLSAAANGLDASIALIKPGVSTTRSAAYGPKAPEFGFPDEMSAFGLQFGHGLGLALHERPIISRVVSVDHPTEIRRVWCSRSNLLPGRPTDIRPAH